MGGVTQHPDLRSVNQPVNHSNGGRSMHRSRPHAHPFRLAVASLAVVFAGACGDQSPVAPSHAASSAARRDVGTSSLTWANQITGTTADGAQYAIYVPAGWNGDVVFYAHGIIPPQAPVILPVPEQNWDDIGSLRDALGQAGFAIAYSSFGENGYAIREGIQRTHQLRGIFTSRVGRPNHSFLVGHSLGAQVVQALAETYPSQYSGALAMCGVLGGTKYQTDYVGHTRALFDFFYPGVLPGNVMSMPENVDPVTQIQLPALNAVMANQAPLPLIAAANQTRLAGTDPLQIITTLLNALTYHALGVNDLMNRTHGHVLFDNSNTFYSSALIPDALYVPVNQNITRFTATPDAMAWLANNYEPTGDLRIPMIAFHKTQDRLVPFRHDSVYQAAVDLAGRSANLLRRSQDSYGHCDLGVDAMMANFNDLVGWVNTGVKP
jgi:pimeloyl-ACP methyl ester carboxylesterase